MNKMNRIILIIFLTIILPLSQLIAQGSIGHSLSLTQNIGAISPSPTAASLGKYGAYPVNESVGLVNISVPIYEVNVGNIKFPIELNYHASGIRVAEPASWVGLGFSLNAGGVITRRVVGLADDLNTSDGKEGFFYKYNFISNNSGTIWEISDAYPMGLPFMDFKLAIDEGRSDYMPDLFYYNFAGKSGAFTLQPQDGQANNLKALMIPHEDIEIQTNMPSNGKLSSFKITDDNGLIYTFNNTEVNYYNQSTTHPAQTPIFDESINTSWYLSLIQDPKTGAEVNFDYEVDSIVTDKHWSYQKNDLYNGICPYVAEIERDSYSEIKSLRLRKISYSGVEIEFIPASTDRQDVLNSKALESVKVFINNQIVQHTKLVTSYFQEGSGHLNKRLRLDALHLLNPISNEVIEKYQFEYNTNTLPSRESTLQDLWGYYQSGAQKFPVKTVIPASPYVPYPIFKYSSVSRMPSSSGTLASSLIKIIYPTGGYTKFNFENNFYRTNDPIYQYITRTNATPATIHNYATPITSSFTINQATLIDFTAIVSPSKIIANSSGNNLQACVESQTASTVLRKVGETTAIRTFMQNETIEDWELPAGTYYFQSTILQEDCSNAMVRVNLTEKKVIGYGTNEIGPGLRIKSIENYDQYSNLTQTERYIYETDNVGHSSGSQFYKPNMVKQWEATCFTMPVVDPEDPLPPSTNFSKYYSLSFNDQTVTGGPLGSSIYYSQVSKVLEGVNNGKITNSYTNQGIPLTSMLSGPLFYMANTLKNGNLTESKIYDQNNNLVRRHNYSTAFINKPSNYGFYAFKVIASQTTINSDLLSVTKYEIKTAVKLRSKETITEYFNNIPITKTIDYSYNRAEQSRPSLITTTFNDNTKIVSTLKYAPDYILPNNTNLSSELMGIKKMQDKRIYDVPLEQFETFIDQNNISKVTAGTLMEVSESVVAAPKKIYSLKLSEGINNFSPSAITGQSLQKDSRYSIDLEVFDYNSGLPTSYLLNNQMFQKNYAFPLFNKLSSLKTNTGANQTELQKVTYNTKRQITSITDANNIVSYYEYDPMGRLISIKDKDGNIIKALTYKLQAND